MGLTAKSGGRQEVKYRLTMETARRMQRDLDGHLDTDKHTPPDGDGRYRIRSLYFDTPGLGCYHAKLAGLFDRLKVRLRSYGDADSPDTPRFLEVKEKRGPLVLKSRLLLPQGAPRAGAANELLRWLRQHWRPNNTRQQRTVWRALMLPALRPIVQVEYRRRAYVQSGPANPRITFDWAICGRRADRLVAHGPGLRPALGDVVVLEIKFDVHMPAVGLRLIRRYNLLNEATSKYTAVVEACAPLYEHRSHRALIVEGVGPAASHLLYHATHLHRGPTAR